MILATGQGTDLTILDGSGVETTDGSTTDPKTLMTKVPGVYAGATFSTAPGRWWRPSAPGRSPRNAIDAWLRGQPMDNAAGGGAEPNCFP